MNVQGNQANNGAEAAQSQMPLVTLAVLGFNQEEYIRTGIEAAFAQTYSPLQIVLSDDCSTDRTFAVMREVAGTYDGPHEIVLNRNEQNVGLAEHLNRVALLARGSIIVLAAGDDISLPDRVKRIVTEFSRSPDVRAVFSGHTEINSFGEHLVDAPLPPAIAFYTTLQAVAKAGGGIGLGATYAYHRDCFRTPRPIPPEIICEDAFLPFRAALLGTIGIISEPLVLHRKHESSATSGARFMSAAYRAAHWAAVDKDLTQVYSSGLVSTKIYRRTRRALSRSPRFLIRAHQLSVSPLVHRLYKAVYFSDIWHRRILARLRSRWGRHDRTQFAEGPPADSSRSDETHK